MAKSGGGISMDNIMEMQWHDLIEWWGDMYALFK